MHKPVEVAWLGRMNTGNELENRALRPALVYPALDSLLFLIVAIFGWWVFTIDNDAPFHRHPDEPGKAAQVLRKDWNFHHPMLMVRGTERVVKILMEMQGLERTAQQVTEIGRGFVAACSALGIAMLSVLARQRFGWLAAIAVAAVMITSGSVFHISHWFKEDPLLTMGWSALALTVYWYSRRPSWWSASLIGAAAAFAASGKYIGVLGLVIAIALVAWFGWRHKQRGSIYHWLALLAVAVPLTCLLNLQVLLNWQDFIAGFSREVHYVQEGHQGVRREQGLHGQYLYYLGVAVQWWAWPLAILGFAAGWIHRDTLKRQLHWPDIYLIVLLGVYLLLISLSPKIIHRYTYPISYFLLYYVVIGASVGLPLLLQRLRLQPPLAVAAGGLASVALCATQFWFGDLHGVSLRAKLDAYRLDTFAGLHDWINQNLPPDAVIYQVDRYYLPDPDLHIFKDVEPPVPQLVLSKGDLFDHGSLAVARSAGVTHVLVNTTRHTRYSDDSVTGASEVMTLRDRRAATFEALHAEGRIVYQMEPGPESSLHPAVTMYDIRQPTADEHP